MQDCTSAESQTHDTSIASPMITTSAFGHNKGQLWLLLDMV